MKNKTIYFSVPTKCVSSLFFHPSKNKILVSSKTGGLLMYQIGSENRPFSFTAPNFSPIRGFITPDGNKIIGASFEGKVALWENHNEKPLVVQQGHSSSINDLDMLIHRGHFMTAGNDKVVKLWDPNLKFLSSFTDHNCQVTSCAFDQTSKAAISGDASGTVLLWDYTRPEDGKVWDFHLHKTKRYPITSIDVDSTGRYFSVLSAREHLGVFDLRNPEHVVAQPFKAKACMAKLHPLKEYLLCTGSNNSEMIFNIENNSLLFSFEGHNKPVSCCAWSNDGKKFATADDDGTVIIWNLPKPPKLPKYCPQEEATFTIQSKMPSINTTLSLEVLNEELSILTEHVNELNEKLKEEESRINQLVLEYRWRM